MLSKSRHLRSAHIYVLEHNVTVIIMAKKTGAPYRVYQITYEDFHDLTALQEEGTNFNVDINKKKVKWNDMNILKVERENPETLFHQMSYADSEFINVNVQTIKNRFKT